MFIVPLKTLATDAMRQTFDADYLDPQFRNLPVSIEFPEDRQSYPGLWVDFEPSGEMERVGIGHSEVAENETGTGARRFTRWRFQGYLTYTIAAMTSLERDGLLDEVLRVLAFGAEAPQTREFRAYIEDNEFLACNIDFDQVAMRGMAASPGTPWGTDDMIYEATLAVEILGEFVSDSVTATLVPLTAIDVQGYADVEGDPDPSW